MLRSLSFVTLLYSATFLSAQQQYTWDMYDLSFTLADDFEEVTNDEDEFSAMGYGMDLTILPFHDGDIDADDITIYTMSMAATLELDNIGDLDVIELNDYTGAYAEGEVDGVTIFIMGLIDPQSETNFFILIAFESDDEYSIDRAVDICRSLRRV